MVENYLGWETGRLADLLDGRIRLSFEDVLEILPLLNATPADFFAWLYGFASRDAGAAAGIASPALAVADAAPRGTDRRFDASLRVVKDALGRRAAWKQERSQEKKSD